MSWQAVPFWPQICHWGAYVIGAVPVQAPGFAVTVEPVDMLPLIVGGVVLAGAAAVRAPTAEATPTAMAAARSAMPRPCSSRRELRRPRVPDDSIFVNPLVSFCTNPRAIPA